MVRAYQEEKLLQRGDVGVDGAPNAPGDAVRERELSRSFDELGLGPSAELVRFACLGVRFAQRGRRRGRGRGRGGAAAPVRRGQVPLHLRPADVSGACHPPAPFGLFASS